MAKMTELDWLQRWFLNQCDGDWEHRYVVRIETLDNPGWRLEISVAETKLESALVERVHVERADDDWISYEIRDQKFVGRAGPLGLSELISVFRQTWAEHSDLK